MIHKQLDTFRNIELQQTKQKIRKRKSSTITVFNYKLAHSERRTYKKIRVFRHSKKSIKLKARAPIKTDGPHKIAAFDHDPSEDEQNTHHHEFRISDEILQFINILKARKPQHHIDLLSKTDRITCERAILVSERPVWNTISNYFSGNSSGTYFFKRCEVELKFAINPFR